MSSATKVDILFFMRNGWSDEGAVSEMYYVGKRSEGRIVGCHNSSIADHAAANPPAVILGPADDDSGFVNASTTHCTDNVRISAPIIGDVVDLGRQSVPTVGKLLIDATVESKQNKTFPESKIYAPQTSPEHKEMLEKSLMSPDYSQNCMTSGVAPQVMELSRLMVKRRKTPVEYWRAVKMSKQLVKRAVISEVEIGPDRRPHATVQINGVAITGLLDSGASISCLGKDAFDTIRRCTLKWKEFSDQSAVETASGQQQKIMGYADADVQFQGKTKRIRIYIIPTLKNELYLGIDF